MIDAPAGVAREVISEVIPESIDALVWMQLAQSVGPSKRDQAREGFPHFRPKERIINRAGKPEKIATK